MRSGRGADFLFTIAPNKNSLYGEHMPYYDSLKVSDEKNMDRIVPWLEKEGVHYAALSQVFAEQEEVLYHKRIPIGIIKGRRWQQILLLTALGREHLPYAEAPGETRKDFTGDLDKMLYPLGADAEEEEIYYDNDVFAYVGEVGEQL